MPKIRLKNVQTAQGMVEFALVLPVLLLLLFGIFAFGHLFFTYSSVVSASREAARWGSAVGEAPSSYPRYQDCASIRGAARRIGGFAGVSANYMDVNDAVKTHTGVAVGFDHGPDAAGNSTVYVQCPADGSELPSEVSMGDRIVVRVRVIYTPIVPLVNIPSFPLEATTYRTVMKSVPVGDAPTAVDPCFTDVHIQVKADHEPSVVGQAVLYTIKVVADDTTQTPTGSISLTDIPDSNMCDGDLTNGAFACGPFTYPEAGVKKLTLTYTSDSECFPDKKVLTTDNVTHTVGAAATKVTLTVDPSSPTVHEPFMVHVVVQAVAPGAGVPKGGYVNLRATGLANCMVNLTDGAGDCTTAYVSSLVGQLTIYGDYHPDSPVNPDPNYAASTGSTTITIRPANTATPTRTITPTVIYYTPTKTAMPSYCPRATGAIDFSQSSALQFGISNATGTAKTISVSSVEIDWPDMPTAKLQEIRFGSNVGSCTTSGSDKNCLFKDSAGLDPTHQVLDSGTSGWNTSYDNIDQGASKLMRLVFNHVLPQGHYTIQVKFSNNCIIDLSKDFTP